MRIPFDLEKMKAGAKVISDEFGEVEKFHILPDWIVDKDRLIIEFKNNVVIRTFKLNGQYADIVDKDYDLYILGESRFKTFPFDINEEMDQQAIDNNLAHWSCVDPQGNRWWVRIDGKGFNYNTGMGKLTWIEEFNNFDKKYPLGE